MSLTLRSEAFEHDQPIPRKYTGEGIDVSPPLAWDHVPEKTCEFALICDDPDAPTSEPWVHWVIYHLPASLRSLPENIATEARLNDPKGAMQGLNSWSSGRKIGYRGPLPPPGHGVHHYQFRLYALDAPLTLEPKADKAALLKAMTGHVIEDALLIGTYER
jgi:Raf kinase inhibitor-like YbhB/YbcL family protein